MKIRVEIHANSVLFPWKAGNKKLKKRRENLSKKMTEWKKQRAACLRVLEMKWVFEQKLQKSDNVNECCRGAR